MPLLPPATPGAQVVPLRAIGEQVSPCRGRAQAKPTLSIVCTTSVEISRNSAAICKKSNVCPSPPRQPGRPIRPSPRHRRAGRHLEHRAHFASVGHEKNETTSHVDGAAPASSSVPSGALVWRACRRQQRVDTGRWAWGGQTCTMRLQQFDEMEHQRLGVPLAGADLLMEIQVCVGYLLILIFTRAAKCSYSKRLFARLYSRSCFTSVSLSPEA